jgi:hypothetical protein
MNAITLLKVRKATGATVHLRKDGVTPALCGAVPAPGTAWNAILDIYGAPHPSCTRCIERAPKAKGIINPEAKAAS